MKAILDPVTAQMLRDLDIALWEGVHYKTAVSTGKNANRKDPVMVTLVTPKDVNRLFFGYGGDTALAVEDALARNTSLRALVYSGLSGALARLEIAVTSLRVATISEQFKLNPDALDDDIPF